MYCLNKDVWKYMEKSAIIVDNVTCGITDYTNQSKFIHRLVNPRICGILGLSIN